MKRSTRFTCLLCCILVAFCIPGSLFASEQSVRVHRVAEGDSIRQLLLQYGCITSMGEYAEIRDAFSKSNPGIFHSALLTMGADVSVPVSAKKSGKSCLVFEEQRIVRVEFEALTSAERVLVYLDGPVLPDVFTLKTAVPVRVVCDFDGALPQSDLPRDISCDGRMVHRIRVGHEDKPFKRARVVLDVEESLIGRIEQEFFEQESLFTITIFDASSP
ncbi:MAG: hypothetical protein Q7J24_16240 [Desulfomicrobium sp.]|nr:hypothetical protein [Desulfomicrobium sp.]